MTSVEEAESVAARLDAVQRALAARNLPRAEALVLVEPVFEHFAEAAVMPVPAGGGAALVRAGGLCVLASAGAGGLTVEVADEALGVRYPLHGGAADWTDALMGRGHGTEAAVATVGAAVDVYAQAVAEGRLERETMPPIPAGGAAERLERAERALGL